ncbi:MAG: pyruvate carboxylase [Phenylobacterium zucineum]|nr:MAG: pyruvate carboxylase [Phenylobacterium zucineum]
MRPAPTFFNTAELDGFDAQTAALQDPRPHPTEPALVQLGQAFMSELLDVVLGTALEDHAVTICETFIGGLHSGVQRLEREADRHRDDLANLLRDFDGSEVADTDLQDAKRACDAIDVAARALEFVRDAAAAGYATATGEVWSPWRGSVRGGVVSAAQIDAQAAVRAAGIRRRDDADPGDCVVVFRASPRSDAPEDAGRIFDALNWARSQWPEMSLGLTGASGGERLAKRWAQQKGVRLVLARLDRRFGRAAPFRANDQLMALQPVCVLVLPESLGRAGAAEAAPFKPVMTLADAARRQGVRCIRITARPSG